MPVLRRPVEPAGSKAEKLKAKREVGFLSEKTELFACE
jgi:hypothetical protein